MSESNNLGLLGTESDPSPVGIGYVVVPSNIERDLYVKSAHKNNAIMVRTEDGNLFRNVAVVSEVLERIKFPITDEGYGSMVIFVNVPKYNRKVAVGIIDLLSEANRIVSENQYKIEQISLDAIASLMLDADKGEINVTTTSLKPGKKAKLNITVSNPDDDAEMNVYVSGDIRLHASKKATVVSDNTIALSVEDEKSNQLFNFKYEKGVGLVVTDEFKNVINVNEDLVSIYSESGKKYIEFNKDELQLGTKGKTKEEAVLGQKLLSVLEDLIDIISKAKTNTKLGPQKFMPTTQAKLVKLNKELKKILSASVKLD